MSTTKIAHDETTSKADVNEDSTATFWTEDKLRLQRVAECRILRAQSFLMNALATARWHDSFETSVELCRTIDALLDLDAARDMLGQLAGRTVLADADDIDHMGEVAT